MRQLSSTVGGLALGALVLAACSTATRSSTAAAPTTTQPRQHGYYVYWDQNEEVDYLAASSGQRGQLIAPWDPNGQLCLTPDGSGRFSIGYNPTLAGQHNPGSSKTPKQPPVGEALYDATGTFTGHTSYVPGQYELPGQTIGGDIPPDASGPSHAFNNNGTYTGCAFDAKGDLFASDLGTAQGQFPPPDDGRLIEWFGPDLTSACVLAGPTSAGIGPHHVTGTGGLRQPGDLAFDSNGDLLVPEAGHTENGVPAGRILRFDHTSFPSSPAACGPDGLYPAGKLRSTVFFQGSLSRLPFPQGIARDPGCGCWAIDSVFGDPAVAFFDDQGHQLDTPAPVPGQPLSQLGKDPNGYNPFGVAVAPDGTLFFVDIHIVCKNNSLGDCGPAANGGRVMKVAYINGRPEAPVALAAGMDFPTSVTVCVAGNEQRCPLPPGASG